MPDAPPTGPGPQAFQLVLSDLGTQPDEVLFIDDHAELGNGQRVVRAKHLHGDMVGAGSPRRLRRRPPSATRAIGDSRLRRR